ncbi:MAG: hypothetical protein U0822_13695 [Anaerolineae bacterium]
MLQNFTKRWQMLLALAVVVMLVALMAVLVGPQPAQAQEKTNSVVMPPILPPYGVTYGEWSARWWQWVFSIPADKHPLLDTGGIPNGDCSVNQSGKVWFLGGTFATNGITRNCTIPAGKALLIPVLNDIFGAAVGDCAPTGTGKCDVLKLRQGAAAWMNEATKLTFTVDNIPVKNLRLYRALSPVFSVRTPSSNPIFGLDPGTTYSPLVSDGYWIMLAPLPSGPHTIHFGGTIPSQSFTLDITYHLTVK